MIPKKYKIALYYFIPPLVMSSALIFAYADLFNSPGIVNVVCIFLLAIPMSFVWRTIFWRGIDD